MKEEEINSVGLWKSCFDMESVAFNKNKEMLKPFHKPIETCYECGVEVTTLKCHRTKTTDLRIASLFLKRALTDLRAIWHLLLLGYTSQAGSIAAATFEISLISNIIAGNEDKAKLIIENNGDSIWSVLDLCKMYAEKRKKEVESLEKVFNEKDFQKTWMEIYGKYKWLCKIKHPTVPSAFHDALSATIRPYEFIVMAVPDFRKEDMPVKSMILNATIGEIYESIRSYCLTIDMDYEDSRVNSWFERFKTIIPESVEACKQFNGDLPFDISDSKLAIKYRELMRKSERESASD